MSAAAKRKRESRAARQRALEKRRLSSVGQPLILEAIAPTALKRTPMPKAPQLLTQSRDAIDGLRESASRTGGHAAASLLHLADLLTFHRAGFPNVREVRW